MYFARLTLLAMKKGTGEMRNSRVRVRALLCVSVCVCARVATTREFTHSHMYANTRKQTSHARARTHTHTHTHTDALNDTKGKSRPEMTTSTGAKLENVNELVLSLSCHYMLTSDKFFHRSQAETSSYLERLHAGGQTYGCRL